MVTGVQTWLSDLRALADSIEGRIIKAVLHIFDRAPGHDNCARVAARMPGAMGRPRRDSRRVTSKPAQKRHAANSSKNSPRRAGSVEPAGTGRSRGGGRSERLEVGGVTGAGLVGSGRLAYSGRVAPARDARSAHACI